MLIILLVVAILVTTTAIVINVYRDSVAIGVANRFLADSDAAVTDVSVDSIGTDAVRFGAIQVGLAGGGVLEIKGVTLPVRFRGFHGLQLHVESLEFLPSPEISESPPDLAAALRAFLEAGPAMHGASIEIDAVSIPAMPALSNVAWYGDATNPTLRASVEDLDVFLTSTPGPDRSHRATLRALTPADSEALLLVFDVLDSGDEIAVIGRSRAILAPLVPLLRFYRALPNHIVALDGTLAGPFEARIADDAAGVVPVRLAPSLDGKLIVDSQPEDAEPLRIIVSTDGVLLTSLEYPVLSWQTEVDSLALEITGGGLESQRIDLISTRCESGLRCRTNLQTTLETIRIGGLSIAAATLEASNVEFESSAAAWTANSDSARLLISEPAYVGRQFVTPSIQGDFKASDERLSTRLRIATPEGGITGTAEILHDLADGRGELRFDDLRLDIDILNFSEAFAEWPYEWDVTSGTWQIEGVVSWRQTPSGFTYEGQSLHRIDALAGSYGEVGFLGFSTEAELSLESDSTPAVAPGSFELALVDIGFPIEDISGRYMIDLAELNVEFEGVGMSALGGSVRIAPFRYDIDAASNDIVLSVEGVQLPLMVGLADLDSVDISGSVSGGVPISVRNGSIVVEEGFLEADPPGGAIRYQGGSALADDQTQLGIVTRTLENFRFEELTSEVHYSEQGDLKLQMRLTGTNPDVDPDQPVILNLGIENNIPQMLRSLQATRSIEELLEEKLSN